VLSNAPPSEVVGNPQQRPAALASVLLDVVELQTVLGRYGAAMEYVEAAASWARDLPALAARSGVLRSEVAARLGMSALAATSLVDAMAWMAESMPRSPDLALRAGRVLCDLGRHGEAIELLDQLIEPEPSAAEDPLAQVVALRARALAPTEPAAAVGLANAALGRRPPLSPLANARIRLDVARALVAAGTPAAGRSAAKRGIKAIQRTGSRGLKLELLLLIAELGADDTVVDTIRKAAEAIRADLPPHLGEAFVRRPAIAALTSR
jgi:tetratricopeptide (TPR) repeat protein